jgi:transcriptional regulator with XRE-family HTH domain
MNAIGVTATLQVAMLAAEIEGELRMATRRPFGVLLQQYRLAAGLSQEELAERAGLSRRGISDLERGERRLPHPATVRRLANALNLDGPERAALLANPRAPAESDTHVLPTAPESTHRRTIFRPN